MPRYDARCNVCQKTQDYTRSIANMHDTPICCDKPMEKVFLTPIAGFLDFPSDGPKRVWGRPGWQTGNV